MSSPQDSLYTCDLKDCHCELSAGDGRRRSLRSNPTAHGSESCTVDCFAEFGSAPTQSTQLAMTILKSTSFSRFAPCIGVTSIMDAQAEIN